MVEAIPKHMQAVLLEREGGPLTVGQIPVPPIRQGQVLVRMAAMPINPSDLGFIGGTYGFRKPFPVVPGFEGSGIVVAGSGLLSRLWMGRRVVCSSASTSGGTWAEYLVTSATGCFPLANNVSLEQGATLAVNPLTALAFLDIAKHGKHHAIISNAAASSLGRMILRLGKTYHIPVIHVVRRQENIALLQSLGGEYVLNSSEPRFGGQLRQLAGQLKATLILDPVAGEQTRQLLDAAPAGSLALIYGYLSGKRIDISALASGYTDKKVSGFFLPNWIAQKNILQVLLLMRRVQQLAANELSTTIQKRLPLSAVAQAITLSQSNPTAGKILLVADPGLVKVDA